MAKVNEKMTDAVINTENGVNNTSSSSDDLEQRSSIDETTATQMTKDIVQSRPPTKVMKSVDESWIRLNKIGVWLLSTIATLHEKMIKATIATRTRKTPLLSEVFALSGIAYFGYVIPIMFLDSFLIFLVVEELIVVGGLCLIRLMGTYRFRLFVIERYKAERETELEIFDRLQWVFINLQSTPVSYMSTCVLLGRLAIRTVAFLIPYMLYTVTICECAMLLSSLVVMMAV
jgi:hypothetical protein